MLTKKTITILISVMLILIGATTAKGATIYVDDDANTGGGGSSWSDAYKYLQDALGAASSNDEIRVAQGVYLPDANDSDPNGSGSRCATFQLLNNVAVKGGYAGIGEPDPNERDPDTYLTILSGDLDGNDVEVDPWDLIDEPTRAENSYHVVTGSGTDETAVLDGFTITGGNADSPYSSDSDGGGMYNYNGDPTVTDCNFIANSAKEGGGMFNELSDPMVANCMFSANYASYLGGGMCNLDCNTIVNTCTFTGNSYAVEGGGMYNGNSNTVLTNCMFIGNSYAVDYGVGGGMYSYDSDPALTNCTFSRNTALWGGGMCNTIRSSATLTNCTFSGNYADIEGGGIINGSEDSNSTLTNCILWGNYAGSSGDEMFNSNDSAVSDIAYCDIRGCGGSGNWDPNFGNDLGGNIDEDPLFVDPNNDDCHLGSNSPCINAGDPNGDYTSQRDIDGEPRVMAGRVDMGSDEFSGVFNIDKEQWYDTIQEAINDANTDDVIEVGPGVYYESVDFNSVSCTVTSIDPNDDDVVAATIIDANSAGRVVTFDSSEDADSILTGFTITGGYAPGTGIDRDGGGIFCYGSSPTISRCVIYDNYAGDDGGGIFCDSGSDPEIYACSISYNESGDKGGALYCRNSDPNVIGCDICSNNANEGGGIYCSSSEPQIERCIISENQTSGGTEADGGGICCLSSSPNILNSIISDNFSDDDGGGIWCDDGSDPNIINCTLTQNEADDKGGGIYCRNSDPVIRNCILWDDTASTGDEIYTTSSTPVVSYSDVEGGWSGPYNINSDPCFIDADANDFHLDSDSPCINTGDPNVDYYIGQTDIDGDPRVIGSIVDMGSDETPYRVHNITQNNWYTTIQSAIDEANDGDEIVAYPDTYDESVEIDVNSITLRSTDPNDWKTVADTIIDANGGLYGIKYASYLDSTLAGLTIKKASNYGIQCQTYSSPTIKNCIVEENGYYGIMAIVSGTIIINNKIRDNTFSGIYAISCSTQEIKNNWIYDNAKGICLAGSNKAIRNNTVVGNSTAGIEVILLGTPLISNCIIWDNNSNDLVNCTATYSCIEDCNDVGDPNTTHNICDDPLFVDAVNDNYHLEPNSPCIDAGDPNGTYTGELDIDFEDRVVGDDVDMGGDEYYDPNS